MREGERALLKTEPPAVAPLAALDRRSLLRGGVLGLGLAAAPLAAHSGGAGFSHGVASGEPGADRVLLWTRYAAAAPATLRYELSKSLDFARPAGGGEVEASPERDWCAKAWATGLEAGASAFCAWAWADSWNSARLTAEASWARRKVGTK